MRQDYEESRLALRFLITAQLFLVVGAGLQLWIAPALVGFPYSPSILALTHVLVLGWATLSCFGALCQLLPVLLQRPLRHHGLIQAGYWLTTLGSAGLSWAFTQPSSLWLAITAALLGVGMLSCLWAFARTIGSPWNLEPTIAGVGLALLALGIQVVVGCLLVMNRRLAFWPSLGLNGAAGHALLGLMGWFTVLTIALSYHLVPMFVLSHGYRCRYMRLSIFGLTINAYAAWIALWTNASPIYIIAIASVTLLLVGLWINDLRTIINHRVRRSFELSMQFFLASGIILAATCVFASMAAAGFGSFIPAKQLQIVFMLGLEAWIGLAIMAMAHKIIPFLVWIRRTSQGAPATPAAVRDLFSSTLNSITLWSYGCGAILASVGVGFQSVTMLRVGSGLMLVAGCGLGANIIRAWKHHSISNQTRIANRAKAV